MANFSSLQAIWRVSWRMAALGVLAMGLGVLANLRSMDSSTDSNDSGRATVEGPDPTTMLGLEMLSQGGAGDDKTIAVPELRRRLRLGDRNMLILDARTSAMFERGHIPGAINFPVANFETQLEKLKDRLNGVDVGGGLIVLYCTSIDCPDASKLKVRLNERGVRRCVVLKEGWKGWEESERPNKARHKVAS